MAKGSDSPFPSLLIEEATEPSAPAAGHQRLYIDSTTHHLKRTDSSAADVDIEAAAAGIPSGTSFPGGPTTNDRYYRTDVLGGTDFKYDGTRWRSVNSIAIPLNQGPVSSSTFANLMSAVPFKGTYTLYLLSAEFVTQLTSGTSDSTHYWTVAVNWDAADTTRNSLGSFDTKTDVAANATYHTIAINAVLSTSAFGFDVLATKTSTPPSLNFGGTIYAQIVTT